MQKNKIVVAIRTAPICDPDRPWEGIYQLIEGEEFDLPVDFATLLVDDGYAEFKGSEKNLEPELNTGPAKPAALTFDDLGLPEALKKRLIASDVTTVEKIIAMTEAEILALDGIGQGKVDDIKDGLEKHGLVLAVAGE